MYYSDKELLEMVESLQVRTKLEREKKYDVANMLRDRLAMKDKHREHISARLNEAANILGHNLISEYMQND